MTAAVRPHKIARYGWQRDLPDFRDLKFKPSYGALKAIPAKADLTKVKGYFDAYDQLQLGSCTGNAIAAALQYDALIQKQPLAEPPSRLFIYYNERVIENTVNSDAGAQIRDGIKVVSKMGAPAESLWPYSDDAKTFKTKPSKAAYDGGLKDIAVTYRRIARDASLSQMRAAIGVDKRPFVFGFSVYESFESAEVAASGIAPMPSSTEQLLGGHAVLAVGYDDKKKLMKVRNSWGTGWGQNGHFWLPYGFFTSSALSSDFWVIDTTQTTV